MFKSENLDLLFNKNYLCKILDKTDCTNRDIIYNRIELLEKYNIDDSENKSFDVCNDAILNIRKLLDVPKTIKKLTTCIMIKDNEETILKTVKSALSISEVVLIVDTGSKDSSKKIIKNINSEKIVLIDKDWDNDFSSIRNFLIQNCTTNWIMMLDSDEVLLEGQEQTIRDYIDLYTVNFKGYTAAFYPTIISSDEETNLMPRIFNKSNAYYFGNCHEELRTRNFLRFNISLPIKIIHTGYDEPEVLIEKKMRNTFLLKKCLEIEPENFRWLYFYTRDALLVEDSEKLKKLIELKLLDTNNSIKSGKNLYTEGIILNYIKILFSIQEFDKIKVFLNSISFEWKKNSDLFYYYSLSTILKAKSEFIDLLYELNIEKNYNFLNSMDKEGRHIELIKGILSYETMDYEEANRLWKELMNQKYDSQLFLSYINFLNGYVWKLGDENNEN